MWWDYAGSEEERKRVLGYSQQEGSGMHWWLWSQVTSKRLLSLSWQSQKIFFPFFFLNIEGFRSKAQPPFFCLSLSLPHFFPSITHSTLLFEGLRHHHWLVTPNYSTLFLLISPFFVSLSQFFSLSGSFTLLVSFSLPLLLYSCQFWIGRDHFSASKYLHQCDISLHYTACLTVSASERSLLRDKMRDEGLGRGEASVVIEIGPKQFPSASERGPRH